MSVSLFVYRLVTALAEPLAPLILNDRARRGKEDAARIGERLGQASVARPDGPLVWLHGVSVGESLSLLPLIERIRARRPSLAVLVTTGTTTAAALLEKRLPAGVIHQYAPVDGPAAVSRFLDHWRPAVGILAESELWPNLILAAKARGVRLALASARITAHSARGWAKRPAAARTLFSAFALVLPQDEVSAERLRALGAKPGPLLNLKDAAAPLPVDETERRALEAATGDRDVVLAASTHGGEEALVARAIPKGPLLIIAPRHPKRAEMIEAELRGLGREIARRSRGEAITARTDVYIADTLGELGLFFALADIVVMGGSLAPGIGGHNPLEPARAGAAIISGPHVFNFDVLYEAMARRGAALIVETDGLSGAIERLLADPKPARGAAAAFVRHRGEAFETGWALIEALLP